MKILLTGKGPITVGLLAARSDPWEFVDRALRRLVEDRKIAEIDRMTGLTLARRAHSRPGLAAALGTFLSYARARGYICFAIDQLSAQPLWRLLNDALESPGEPSLAAETGLVGSPPGQSGRPLLVERGRLYFHRGWRQECELAELLWRRALLAGEPAGEIQPEPMLSGGQQAAVKTALSQRLCVISGGPGTGKTTVAAQIAGAFLRATGSARSDVGLAAPTGKAAARLATSVNGLLAGGGQEGLLQAQTLHRLLGWNRERAAFRFDADRRLPLRLLIVDEVSMVDLDLMHSLLSALPENCRLVLLGDRDQLASVEPGNVLADICSGAAGASPRTPLRQCVAMLARSYRFDADSGIGALAAAINRGDADGALRVLRCGHPDLRWSEAPAAKIPLPDAFLAAFSDPDPGSALAACDRFRVLCAHRRGPFGSESVNRRLIAQLTASGLVNEPRHGEHFNNELFVVVGNHYGIRLFNGDQGIFRSTDDGIQAFVQQPDQGCRRISPHRLPQTQPGFCLTVHRSQGSEFDRVLLILPDESSPLLTRELLYTAITRGRREVEIWGSEAALRAAVTRTTERGSGLADRLRQFSGEADPLAAASAPSEAPHQGELFEHL